MSKPTQRQRAALVLELVQKRANAHEEALRQRRFVAELDRQIVRLAMGSKK